MKKIFEVIGGSRSYHLNTESSDFDRRYCFLNETKGQIIGLERHDHQDIKANGEDSFGWEVRHLLALCRKSNTQILELLWATEHILITPEWKLIAENRTNLIDSKVLFKSLLGYINGERKLMLGERTGRLGGARFETLQRLGYSNKNAIQLLRLTFAGTIFFTQGFFPVDISPYDIHSRLMDIKLNPEKHNPQDILAETLEKEEIMKKAFDNRSYDYKFNLELANSICCELYKPLL